MRIRWTLPIMVATAFAMTGCIQTPTETQSVVDNRPQLTFSLAARGDADSYEIFVDNLDMGSAGKYLAGKNALRVLPGTHILRIERSGSVVSEDKIYLGDGATKNTIIH
jgi:hypothetical protein